MNDGNLAKKGFVTLCVQYLLPKQTLLRVWWIKFLLYFGFRSRPSVGSICRRVANVRRSIASARCERRICTVRKKYNYETSAHSALKIPPKLELFVSEPNPALSTTTFICAHRAKCSVKHEDNPHRLNRFNGQRSPATMSFQPCHNFDNRSISPRSSVFHIRSQT